MPHWTVHLDGGPRRVNHAAAVVGNRIFMFGGYCTGGDYKSLIPIDVYTLDTVSLRWTKLSNIIPQDTVEHSVPYLRYGHSVVNYGGLIYLWGGRNDTHGACNKVFCFDTSTSTWSRVRTHGDKPGGRDGHSACLIADDMYIFGGFEDRMQCYCNSVYTLNLREMHWSCIMARGKTPHWRDFHTATAHGHKMIVFGGRSDRSGPYYTNREFYCNELQVFDTSSKTWSSPLTTGDVPVGRRSHSAFIYKGDLHIFGGYNDLIKTHFSDLYRLDLINYEWSKVKTLGQTPRNRRRQCCIVIKDRVIMFGGTSPKQTPVPGGSDDENLMDLADLHILDFAPSLKTLCKMTVIRYELDASCLPHDVRWEIKVMTTNNSISQALMETPQG